MSRISRRSMLFVSVLLVVSQILLAGCGAAPATQAAEATAPTGDQPAAKTEGLSIALLDGTNGNSWRAQMEEEMSAYIEELKGQGIVGKYTAYSANDDATTQSQQLSQIVNAGETDVVLIDPVSSTALNPVIDKALEKGILVLGVDAVVSHPKVISITTDQAEWASIQAEYLAQVLGGKGNIIIYNGISGFPASDTRTQAYKDTLVKYPDIKVLKEVWHDWDEGKSKQLTLTMLTAFPEIDGILNQETSPGIMSAFAEANRPLPKVLCSDESINYLRMWNDYNQKNPDNKVNGIIVGNPPGIGVSALKIAVQMLHGKTLKEEVLAMGDTGTKNSLLIKPNLVITNDNLAEWIEKTKDSPETYTFSNSLTDEEVAALFQ